MIIIDFDFYEKLIKVGDISSNKELINYFYNVADMMGALNYSLNDYSSYYEDLKQFDIEQTFKGSDSNIDSVNLLTIHASKGLELAKKVMEKKMQASEKQAETSTTMIKELEEELKMM